MRTSPLQRVVKKRLAKDPDDRWQSAADLRDELKWIKEGDVVAAVSDRRPGEEIGDQRSPLQGALPWALVAAAIVVALVFALVAARYILQPKTEESVIRFSIPPPEHSSFGYGQFSL